MSIAEMLHSMEVAGRTPVLDEDLDRLAREHPRLTAVFEETQFLRREVERLMEDVWAKQSEIDSLR